MRGAKVVVGAQWGDEGKGKIVDHFARSADWVVRYQGGANAGHTLVVDGRKTVLHLIPSGALHPKARCAIAAGCVVDPEGLLAELDALEAAGAPLTPERLRVSERAHLVLSIHRHLDVAREAAAGAAAIGTTGRGIGPAYEDAVGRRGVRFAELVGPASALADRVERLVAERNLLLVGLGAAPVSAAAVLAELAAVRERLAPYVGPVGAVIAAAIEGDETVIFEGAQGVLLDCLHGTYPFVTSSSTGAGGVCTGTGIGPRLVGEVLGVTKAYATRVGAGPFPTELNGALEARLRAAGGEFGATTGRPRRCGWLDLPALRTAARLGGLTGLVVTKLDVLGGFDEVRMATGYRVNGQVVEDADVGTLADAEPIYEVFAGWGPEVGQVRHYLDLPASARHFLERLSAAVELPIELVSVGPERDAIIACPPR
ncbi:MAG: adenylosuccinate synthase [Myxococcales bacterium]|nr:adenylosuccinate synthase [Myxococcales bacterium]